MATSVNAVLGYLMKNPGPHGPTKIGLACGLSYVEASSGVMKCLRSLEKSGAVKRVIVKNKPTDKGHAAYEATGVIPRGLDMNPYLSGASSKGSGTP